MSSTAPGRAITEEREEGARMVVYPPAARALAYWLERGNLDVGRDGANGLCLDDARVSAHHARIRVRRDNRRLEITDQASSNGTFVNGERLERAILEDGDTIRMGDSLAGVEVGFEAAGADDPDRSLAALRVSARAAEAAASGAPLLLSGPTGAGKGYLARRIAERSERTGPFLHVNCAAVPADLIESELFGHVKGAFTGAGSDKTGLIVAANGGTLLLDEIGAAPMSLQAKLLTCIEEGEVRPVGATRSIRVDVRFIAATNIDVDAAVESETLRRDLYYRLSAIAIRLPPLSARRADIVPVACRVLGVVDHRAFTAEALEALLLFEWPGNFRELVNLAERLRTGGDRPFDYHCLPRDMTRFLKSRRARVRKSRRWKMPSREFLEAELGAAGGNVSELARRLGKHRNQVVRWLDAYGLR